MSLQSSLRLCCAVALMSSVDAAASTAQTPRTPQVVDIKAADGTVLKGTLYSSGQPGPAVLLLHQCDEQRKVWNPLGDRLAASGVTALSTDYRGYGESAGTPHDKLSPAELSAMMTDQLPSDIDAAFAYLSKVRGVDTTRMGAGGGSCGVNNAINLAMRHSNVRALALLAGAPDRAAREFLERSKALPVFTAAAADDRYANFVEIMPWFAALSANPQSRVAQYRDGGHAAVVFRTHPGLADTIATWMAIVLHARTGPLPSTNGVPMKADVLRTLHELDQPGGAALVGKRLTAARKQRPDAQLFPEYFANQLGYEHMIMKDPASALAIMQLNADAYPASPNAMDSLGDIYLARGEKSEALRTARRTLELLDRDTVDTESRKKDIRAAAEAKIKELAPRGI